MFGMLKPFMKKEDLEKLQGAVGTIFRTMQETHDNTLFSKESHEKTLENNRMLRVLLTPAQLKKAEVAP